MTRANTDVLGVLTASLSYGAVAAPSQTVRQSDSNGRAKLLIVLGAAVMAAAPMATAQCPVRYPTTISIADLHWFPREPAPPAQPIRKDFHSAVSADQTSQLASIPTPYSLSSIGNGQVNVQTPNSPLGGGTPWWPTPLNAKDIQGLASTSPNVQYWVKSTGTGNVELLYSIPDSTVGMDSVFSMFDTSSDLWVYSPVLKNDVAIVNLSKGRPPTFVQAPANIAHVFTQPVATQNLAEDYGLAKMAYDGTNFWVAEVDAGSISRGIYKIPAAAGGVPVLYNPFAGPPAGIGYEVPNGLFFDGIALWVSTVNSSTRQYFLHKLDLNGNVLATIQVGAPIAAMAFDGVSLWVTVPSQNLVEKINAGTASVTATLFTGPAGVITAPLGIAFDGFYMWVANNANNTLARICTSTNQLLGTEAGGGDPFAVAFDGTGIWVTNPRSGVLSYRAE